MTPTFGFGHFLCVCVRPSTGRATRKVDTCFRVKSFDARLMPVKKLSRQMTSWPSAIKRSQRCEPRNPAPPVTNTVLESYTVPPSLLLKVCKAIAQIVTSEDCARAIGTKLPHAG